MATQLKDGCTEIQWFKIEPTFCEPLSNVLKYGCNKLTIFQLRFCSFYSIRFGNVLYLWRHDWQPKPTLEHQLAVKTDLCMPISIFVCFYHTLDYSFICFEKYRHAYYFKLTIPNMHIQYTKGCTDKIYLKSPS
jgi:hypothetical protein